MPIILSKVWCSSFWRGFVNLSAAISNPLICLKSPPGWAICRIHLFRMPMQRVRALFRGLVSVFKYLLSYHMLR